MIESEIFAGFSLRELPGDRRVAVLHLIAPDGGEPCEESVFDEASLAARVRTLQALGSDTSVSEAALRALKADSARAEARPAAARLAVALDFDPVRRPEPLDFDAAGPVGDITSGGFTTGLPGRPALLRALRNALALAGASRGEHGPHLAVLTARGTDALAARFGDETAEAALLGIADRLDENLRRMDTLVHLGGPRFAACLPRVPRQDAEGIARRLARAIAATPIDSPAGPVSLRIEVGIFGEATGAQGSTADRAEAMLTAAERTEAALDALPEDSVSR